VFYTDAIYLILALLLFSGWPAEPVSLEEIFPLFLGKEALFCLVVYLRFKKARKPLEFLQTQALLKLLAFLFFTIDVVGLSVPGLFEKRSFLRESGGLILFLHYFLIIWVVAALYEKRSIFVGVGITSYVWSHFKLLLPFLIPWVTINLSFILIEKIFPLQGFKGEIIYLATFLGALVLLMAPLAVKFWDCHPLPESNLRRRIEEYLQLQKTKVKEIHLWETFSGRLLTAGVIGVLPSLRYLLLSTGLLAALEESEILSVVAHEVGHLKRHHMIWLLIFFILFSILIYLAFYPFFLVLLARFPFPEILSFLPAEKILLPEALFTLVLVITVIFYFRFLLGFFLRNFERQADLYCLESLGTGQGLIRAFKKIAALSGNTEDLPSWHHFSIRERVAFLMAAEKDPSLIRRHHRKVKFWLGTYLSLSILLSVIFWQMPVKNWERKAKLNLLYGMLLRESKVFDDLETLEILGNVAYELGREKEALKWYQKAFQKRPSAELKNNLAWILITAKDKSLRNYKLGLLLAREATAERLLATHLDTLAEAWFENHNPLRACLYGSLALDRALKAPDFYQNLEYYRSQKEKFCHVAR